MCLLVAFRENLELLSTYRMLEWGELLSYTVHGLEMLPWDDPEKFEEAEAA